MDGSGSPLQSPFEALYAELCNSFNRFDEMMQQGPFGSFGFIRPPSFPSLQQGVGDATGQQQQMQQLQQQGSGGRQQQMCPWGGNNSSNSNSMVQRGPHGSSASWFTHNSCIPRIDLKDAGDKLVLHADIPGIDKKDVKVEAHDGRLVIQAASNKSEEHKDSNWYMQERCSSNFYRSFQLPANIQEEAIKATYNNGVLEVNIPKTPQVQTTQPPRSINVE